ncbi:MAG: hypothetical protein V1719_01350 [Patescibacteria group bacterium]
MAKSISDELQEILDTQKAFLGAAKNLSDIIVERVTDPLVDVLKRAVEEKNQQLAKLTTELHEVTELVAGYQKDEEEWRICRTGLETNLSRVRDEIRRLKNNESANIEEIRALRKVADDYATATQGLIDMFDELYLSEVESHAESSPGTVYYPCTAVLICCGDGQYESRNSRLLDQLKKHLPTVKFVIDQPIFISSQNPVRPPFPSVDLVILFTAGLSHTDGDAIRNDIKRDNQQTHISTHICSLSLIVLELRRWLTNPDFAKVSTVC